MAAVTTRTRTKITTMIIIIMKRMMTKMTMTTTMTMLTMMTTMTMTMKTMMMRLTTMMGTACRKPAGRWDPSGESEHGESFLDSTHFRL